MAWFRFNTGVISQPLSYTSVVHTSSRMLKALTIHWDAAPTTSENIVITLDSSLGAQYDTVIYMLDPSADSTTDVLLTDINMPIYPGDAVRVTFANTDANTIGIMILFSDWWA